MTASRAAKIVVAQQADPTRVEPPTARRVSTKSTGYHVSIFFGNFLESLRMELEERSAQRYHL